MIHSVKFNLLRNAEHIGLNNDISYVCEQADPEVLNIKAQFDVFSAGNQKLEAAYLQQRGSELTRKIEAEDMVRDNYITGIEKNAYSMTHHFNPVFVEAGERIYKQINQYGPTIARMNFNAETTVLNDLIDKTKNDVKIKVAVATLSLGEWFAKLEESNAEFHRLYMIRVDEEAGKPDLDLKELRNESIIHYRELVKYLTSHAVISPSELYQITIKKFNEVIDKYNALRR